MLLNVNAKISLLSVEVLQRVPCTEQELGLDDLLYTLSTPTVYELGSLHCRTVFFSLVSSNHSYLKMRLILLPGLAVR